FVLENVGGLLTKRFSTYVKSTILDPLRRNYAVSSFTLDAGDFGVPQKRRRVFLVGFRDPAAAATFVPPMPTHCHGRLTGTSLRKGLQLTMGAREALG